MVNLPKNYFSRLAILIFVILAITFPRSISAQGFLQGDLDKDGDVDIFDYNSLASNFGSTNCGNVADIDGNCKVDIFDYNLLVGNFGKVSGTPTPTTRPSISPPPTPIPGKSKDIWITKDEISKLPTSGQYWDQLVSAANNLPSMSASGGHESTHDVYTMAAALVAARLNDSSRKQVVASEIIEAVNNQVENDGNSLSLTRTLPGYIIAADLIDLKNFDASADGSNMLSISSSLMVRHSFRSTSRPIITELKPPLSGWRPTFI